MFNDSLINTIKHQITSLSLNQKKNLLLIGCKDGSIVLQTFEFEKYKNTRPSTHQIDPVHLDVSIINLHGNCSIVNISISFDSSLVFSSDVDGGFFMSKNKNQKVQISGFFFQSLEFDIRARTKSILC